MFASPNKLKSQSGLFSNEGSASAVFESSNLSSYVSKSQLENSIIRIKHNEFPVPNSPSYHMMKLKHVNPMTKSSLHLPALITNPAVNLSVFENKQSSVREPNHAMKSPQSENFPHIRKATSPKGTIFKDNGAAEMANIYNDMFKELTTPKKFDNLMREKDFISYIRDSAVTRSKELDNMNKRLKKVAERKGRLYKDSKFRQVTLEGETESSPRVTIRL